MPPGPSALHPAAPPGQPRAAEPTLGRALLTIDLDAIAGNFRLISGKLAGARCGAVVKADAYGHGIRPVARALVAAGADGLCVATLDEAFALRADGIRLPLLVLYPVPPRPAPEAPRRGLTLTAGAGTPPADHAA